MTAIAAYNDGENVWIACDTIASEENGYICKCGTKLIDKKAYVIGSAQSLRVLDIMRDAKDAPKRMMTIRDARRFAMWLKKQLINDGANKFYRGEEYTVVHPFHVLLVSPYGIWEICPDYAVIGHPSYASVGSGREVAMGVMMTYDDMKYWTDKISDFRKGIEAEWECYAQRVVECAVDAAAEIINTVGGDIESRGFRCK
jgi:hypothetical protein